ncbi:MAG: ribonucleoside-triphosphate reductase [Candidatus Vogelbacteria bacterium]|nr:ribonucleoside-triphosphate reductase [Candidatus Vogelbacteria bacterium]
MGEERKLTKREPAKMPRKVMKRDGVVVDFDISRVTNAISRAMVASQEGKEGDPRFIAYNVVKEILRVAAGDKDYVPSVEEIQDIVENELILMNFVKTAKAYILYREKRAEARRQRGGTVPTSIRQAVIESQKYFQNQLSEYLFYSAYSKWMDAKGRRETWAETIDRYNDFMRSKLGNKLSESEYKEVRDYMLNMKALGSMRLLWAAGSAAEVTNVCAYNCAFIVPTKWQDFGEIMYVLMCGTGIGFSAERQNVELLPIIKRQIKKKASLHVIEDSKEGWANAFVLGLTTWSSGEDITFDYSKVRPQGARLKTMGSRASGPEPLKALLDFSRGKMLSRQGRHLTTLDVHDMVCKTGGAVVMGGARRSALISLSELDDFEMRDAKNGQFYLSHPERSMANNSVAYNEKPTVSQFLEEWINLVKSGSGERGIFNRGSLQKQVPARRWKVFEKDAETAGINPCGEIILKSKQFCNLSQVVARAGDTESTLIDKVRVATILGTYQASLTYFPYLSKEWKKNCDEEALLGVSIDGHWDCKALRNPDTLKRLRDVAIETNKKYAKKFGVNPSTAITCVKPSGQGSQLFNCASGCHPRHAKFYIRRVRIESHNPLFMMLRDTGVPYFPEVGQDEKNATAFVLEFPIASPKGAIVKNDLTALDQLEYWKMIKENFTEHNPSVTISVSSDEWFKAGSWVYENWDMIGGLSFLPRNDHVYRLAPYEEITEEKYNELAKKFPKIDFSKLILYEYDDQTKGAKELACVAGLCEVDPLTGDQRADNK